MIFTNSGNRKYLTQAELLRFLRACETLPLAERAFCYFLAHTGCRISEALEMTLDRIDTGEGVVIIRTLKRRSGSHYRAVPTHPSLIASLREYVAEGRPEQSERLWSWWCRTKAWKMVKSAMERAEIRGVGSCPKALRHSFAIRAIRSSIPPNIVQKWLGRARMETTAIYANAIGDEEKELAQRMWI